MLHLWGGRFSSIGLMALAARLTALGQQAQNEDEAKRQLQHHQNKRGNAARVDRAGCGPGDRRR